MPMLALADEQVFIIAIVGAGGGMLVALVAIVMDGARKISQTRQREESRREIAAYVAEGSISPQDAERILRAGNGRGLREAVESARDAIHSFRNGPRQTPESS
ncbi:MAG: hypothetical protein H6811_03425 [Phycisphaeraceae bacterium]|nr:hypothetical protein [Phycisphaeraceae bacterium]